MKNSSLAALMIAAIAIPGAAMAQQTPAAAATVPDPFATSPQVPATPRPAPTPPDARAEPALRAFIEGAQKGTIDTSGMTDDLKTAIGGQSAQISTLLTGFGAVRTVTHIGKQDGADLFGVVFEQAATQWIIGFDAEGRIGFLLFRPAETTGAPAAQ